MERIFSNLLQKQIQTLSIIGLSKNAGKTTVLNACIQGLHRQISLGLVSIGVDGEERDAWSGREKPLIWVPTGMMVATASAYLDLRAGDWEIIQATGISSSLGEIFIARATRETYVKLAGVPTREGIKRMIQMMKAIGTKLVLVDGAYDRKASASPFVTEASILVVGASMNANLAKIRQQVEETLHLFRLPAVQGMKEKQAIQMAIQEKSIIVITEDGKLELLSSTSLLQLQEVITATEMEHWQTLAIPGALTDRILQRWIEVKQMRRIIVPDATHLFLKLPTLRRFHQRGGQVEVLESIQVLGVAINPLSPEGYSFKPEEMKQIISSICAPLPVFDVIRDSTHEGGRLCF